MSSAPFMRDPEPDIFYDVGDSVEVFCDHEKGSDRIRGGCEELWSRLIKKWSQFNLIQTYFLTDGWMVPDHILWFPHTSLHIRPIQKGQKAILTNNPDIDY